MPKWHKIRRKKPVFGAILCQNGTRLMPKWHSQNACMSNFRHLWRSGEEAAKKGAVRPHFWGWYGNKLQRWVFPILLGNHRHLCRRPLQPCTLVCITNKPFPPTSGGASQQVATEYPPGLCPQVGTLFPSSLQLTATVPQRVGSLCKTPEPPHVTGPDRSRCGALGSTKCTRQPRRLDDKAPPPAHQRKNLIPTGGGNFFHL